MERKTNKALPKKDEQKLKTRLETKNKLEVAQETDLTTKKILLASEAIHVYTGRPPKDASHILEVKDRIDKFSQPDVEGVFNQHAELGTIPVCTDIWEKPLAEWEKDLVYQQSMKYRVRDRGKTDVSIGQKACVHEAANFSVKINNRGRSTTVQVKERKMTQEQENFYRHSTVIVDETKDSFLHLLEFHLTNQGITLQRFIEIIGHDIYHLCFNCYPCCQCPPGTRTGTRGSRVLHPPQLDILFDKTGSKLPGHNPGSKSAPNCCCPVNANLQLHDLDFTLARFLLVNFTTLVPQGSPERSALDFLANSRNHSFAHAKEGKIPNSEYQKSMPDVEASLLVLAKVYNKEAETKQRLRDIAKQPLNIAICLQLQNTLLQQCQLEETIKRLLPEKILPERKMTQEQENFYRHSTVIVDETKDSFLHLLEFHLTNQGITLQRFIEIIGHDIYHLCFNCYPCCQCPPGTRTGTRGSRVLHPPQLDILFDKTGSKLPGHNPGSKSAPNCCCPVNANLQLHDLDFTLARFLLVNFTTLVPQGSPERSALDFLANSRIHSFAHAKEGKIPNSEYQKSMADVEASLLVLANVYNKEAETKQRLRDIAKQPLNIAICLQLQNTLLQQCQLEETIKRLLPEKILPERKMTQEQENFYRHSTVIVDETKDSFLHLLEFHLTNQGITLQRFIEIIGHDIYHLCFNCYPCCQCPPGTRTGTRGSRVLHPPQLDILFDKTGSKLPGHNPGSKSAPNCCCPVNANLQLHDLDFTLARFLLVNFTTLVPQGSPERSALDFLANSRIHSFAHAKEGKIPNSEYQKSMADVEASLLVLANVYNKEAETKQRLRDIAKQPLNIAICLQLQNTLLQQCQLEETIKRLLPEKILPECLTRDLRDIRVIEGNDAKFEFRTKEHNIIAEWFTEDNRIDVSDKFVIETSGLKHTLVVRNADLTDRGIYTAKFEGCERSARLDIDEYFTKNMKGTYEYIEGDIVELSCAVLEDNVTAHWEKDGVSVQHGDRYTITDEGKKHKLAMQHINLQDAGDYCVKICDRMRSTSLNVKGFLKSILEQKTQWTNKIFRNWKIIKKSVNLTPLMEALSKYNLISELHIRDLRAIDRSLAIDHLLIKSIGSITNEKTFVDFTKAISEASLNPDEIRWDEQTGAISADGITENIFDNLQRSKSALKNILKEKHIIKIKDDFIEQLIFSLEDEEKINESLINGSKPTVFIETVFERVDKGSLRCLMMGLRNLHNEFPAIRCFLRKLEQDQTLSKGTNRLICKEENRKIFRTSDTPVETYKIKLEVKHYDTEIELDSQLKKSVLNNTSVIYERLASQIVKTSPGCLEIYLRSVDGNIRKRLSASLNDDTLLNIVSKIMNDDEMRKSLPPGKYKLEARIVTFNQPGHLGTHSCDHDEELKRIQNNIIGANRTFLKRQLDTETVFYALLTKEINRDILKSIENIIKDETDCEKQADVFLEIIQKEHLEEMFLKVLKEADMSYIYNRLETFKRVYFSDFSSLRINLEKKFTELLKIDIDDVKDVFVERNLFESLFESIEEDFEERPDQGMATLLIEIIKFGPVAMLTLVDALYICKMNELADLLLEQSENVQEVNPEELAVSSNSLPDTEEFLFEGDYDIIVTEHGIEEYEEENFDHYSTVITMKQLLAEKQLPDFFTKDLCDVTVTEGCDAQFEIWTKKYGLSSMWFHDGVEIVRSEKLIPGKYGKIHSLYIRNTFLSDKGLYTIRINDTERQAHLDVKEYFTKNLQSVECIEGETAEFTCEVLEDSLPARWNKNGIYLENDGKYEILQAGKFHRLSIKNCELHDTANYTVSINNRVRETSLGVIEYFTKALGTVMTCIEGEIVQFECEVLDDKQTALWFKDGTKVSTSDKYKVEKHGRLHRLVVNNATHDDKGEYSVRIKHCVRQTELVVQEIPKAIQQLSVKDKELYMEILKCGNETRYYIRIVIIGENGVGKTCLLRRLLRQSTKGVQSTDGVDIHRCKINLSNGEWIVDEVSDKKKALLWRLKKAIHSCTGDKTSLLQNYPPSSYCVPGLQDDENSQSNIRELTGTSHNSSGRKQMTIYNKLEDKSVKMEFEEQMMPIRLHNLSDKLEIEVESTSQLHHGLITKLLNEEVFKALDDFFIGIDEVDIPSDVFVECGLLDFAGEKEYYATHPIFLNPNAIHLLVTNIMKDVQPIKTEDGFDKIGGYIDFWLDNIHCYARTEEFKEETKTEFLYPPVIIVCTRMDECIDHMEERKQVFFKQLGSVLRNETKKKHIRDICYVSNTEYDEEDFCGLRDTIFKYGKQLKTFAEELPLNWIRLEHVIDVFREAGVNILSWSDIVKLSSKCSIDNTNEINLFLKYQHKVGSVIYFESLKEYIILNQKWLANAFRCLVSDKFDTNLKLTDEWRRLVDTGKLDYSLIVKLFDKEPELHFGRHSGHLLNVMEIFGIIVKLTTLIENGQRKILPTYYMPCMITEKASFTDIIYMFNVKKDNCKRTPWLCIEFDFMPFDFFNHIFCYYINEYAMCTEPKTGRMAIYHGMGVFFLDNTKFRKFILCFCKNAVALQIWQWRDIGKGKCKAMLEELKATIERVKERFETRRVFYTVKSKCSDGNIHNPAGRNSYSELLYLEDEYFCEEHSDSHSIQDFFQTWFEDHTENEDYVPARLKLKGHEVFRPERKITQDQENFYHHSTVIVYETKDSFLHLLDFHLTNQGKTLQRFIEIYGHSIYHLCFNHFPCCQCPPGTRAETRGSGVLHPPQMDILFDKTGSKLPSHNPESKSAPHCCCPVNPNLKLQDLDLTLARLLLTPFVQQGSPEWSALDFLVTSRNQSFAYAIEGKISNSEYQKSMADIEKSLLVLAKVYGKEGETKRRLRDIVKQPFNVTISQQLQNTLFNQCQFGETMKILSAEMSLPGIQDTRFNQKCHVCCKEPSVYWCHGCQWSFCKNCNYQHMKKYNTEDHVVQHVQDMYLLDYNFTVNVKVIYDIKVLHDMLIIADRWGNQLVTCHISGQHKHAIPLPGGPFCIAVVDNNTVAVTIGTFSVLPSSIVIVDVRTRKVIQLIDVKEKCSGFLYRDNHMFYCCMNKTLKIMNMSGEATNSIGLGVMPWCICGGKAGLIYYTDHDKLYCIDTVGNMLFTFTDPNMSEPAGITTDDEGNVLVICKRSYNVLRISPYGLQSQVIITQIPSSTDWHPNICYSSLYKSVVTGCYKTVHVYKKV